MVTINTSNYLDYQAILINAFTAYLSEEQSSSGTLKNYSADVNLFLTFILTSKSNENHTVFTTPEDIVKSISTKDINNFRLDELAKGLTVSTINRQMSSIRSFFNFASHKGWININPASGLSNDFDPEDLINSQFDSFLQKEGASEKTRINYRSDINTVIAAILTDSVNSAKKAINTPQDVFTALNKDAIENYKSKALNQLTPNSTINRRLSAIRAFIRFGQANKWIIDNPMETIPNVGSKLDSDSPDSLNQYRQYLLSLGMNEDLCNENITDITEFINWIDSNSTSV